MHFSHSAEQLGIISKSFLTESQSNSRSISENVILASDVLSPPWLGPGPGGGWGGWGQQASVRHLGQHSQRGQQDGEHRADGQDTGDFHVLCEHNFKWDSF